MPWILIKRNVLIATWDWQAICQWDEHYDVHSKKQNDDVHSVTLMDSRVEYDMIKMYEKSDEKGREVNYILDELRYIRKRVVRSVSS